MNGSKGLSVEKDVKVGGALSVNGDVSGKAGEILLTSMDADGTKNGYDLAITSAISNLVEIPVIASGGAGTMEHILEVFKNGADAALAASIFHYKEIEISKLKEFLKANQIGVRI